MYWWRHGNNYGDMLSPVIVQGLTGMPIRWSTEPGKLIAIGSVIEHYNEPGDVVWGSGARLPDSKIKTKGVRFLSVRGPLTRQRVLDHGGKCPPIYGDPALFLPKVYARMPDPKFEAVAMPHLDDDAGWNYCHRRGIRTINPS
jgi:hypothetical protein